MNETEFTRERPTEVRKHPLLERELIGQKEGPPKAVPILVFGGLAVKGKAVLRRRKGQGHHCSFAYSALASFRMGRSASASFQRAKKSW